MRGRDWLGAAVADLVTGLTCPARGFTHPPPPAFAAITIGQCAERDPVCSDGTQPSYTYSDLAEQAANFVVHKV